MYLRYGFWKRKFATTTGFEAQNGLWIETKRIIWEGEMSKLEWFRKGVLTLAVVIAAAVSAAAPASAKTISGELQCRPGDKIAGIWILGSQSGWHGVNYPAGKQPRVGEYRVLNAIPGETLQAWLRCNVLGESYHRFTVGRGDKRHICSSGPCLSVNVGACGLAFVIRRNIFEALRCTIRNA